jgi:hypothetical protein
MRSRPGSRPTSARNGPAGGGAQYGSPTSGPEVASSSAALSRTLHVTAWPAEAPPQPSPASGPIGLRARVGLRPNSPQQEAGMRMEPPPSVACAIGTMPDATAAAEPPLEPPALWSRRHGLRVGPNARGSVDGHRPISGVFVLPTITRPARLSRAVISLSWSATLPSNSRLP